MALMLSRFGYKVSSVASGEEAMDYVSRDIPDILVLDMIMDPGMDGLQTYRMISKINPNQKAIIVTGYAKPELMREARNLGIGDFIQKPCKIEKVAAAIRRELDRKGE
jgi:two-component system, cell cycle sensor histidine kinase and response regulator CckA